MPLSCRIVAIQLGRASDDIAAAFGDQGQWFKRALAEERVSLSVCCPANCDPLPHTQYFDLAILSGSWSMVTDREDWSERTLCSKVG